MGNSDPWSELQKPRNSYAMQRVDSTWPNFWWILSPDSRVGFLYEVSNNLDISSLIPKLKGVSVDKIDAPSQGMKMAIKFELQDSDDRDIFFTFCKDLFDTSKNGKSDEEQMLHAILLRAWRWHHLLRGGSSDKLSKEEQKGLIGELQFLNKLLSIFNPLEALHCWTAPYDSPKDFEIGSLYVEVKARRGAARPHISISSEDQLEVPEHSDLFLYIFEINNSPSESPESFNLDDLVNSTSEKISETDLEATRIFYALLAQSGYDPTDNYKNDLFVRKSEGEGIYEVIESFPRIVSAELDSGVSRVQYSISINECSEYKVDQDYLDKKILDVING